MSDMIADLRRGWRESIAKNDRMVEHLERGNLVHPGRQDGVAATAAFVAQLRDYRADYVSLLAQLPG